MSAFLAGVPGRPGSRRSTMPEESRNVILSETETRAIIHRSNEQSAEFGLLVETAAVTGARISQLPGLGWRTCRTIGVTPA